MFAKISEVSEGAILQADGGFDCLLPGDKRKVRQDAYGLYICCHIGNHYLDGQICGNHYSGLTLREPSHASTLALSSRNIQNAK